MEKEMNGLRIENGHDKILKSLQWRLALINDTGKYLTAESFGCKINVTGVSAKKKQIWSLEYHPKEDNVVYLKSHLGRYLKGDMKGKATCETEEEDVGEMEKFTLVYKNDGSGKWAFKNKKTGFFLGCASQEVQCHEKVPEKSEWWTVQIFCHPHLCLFNIGRQKFASVEEDCLRLTTVVPWGVKCLFTLEFHAGKYRVKSSDGRYLCKDGSLTADPSSEDMTCYGVELKTGTYTGLVFRDSSNKCLSGVGKDATVQGKGSNVGRDELFSLQHAHPQVVITAHNGRMVSTKQGVDPTANQEEEVTEKEIFQLEHEDNGFCRLMSSDGNFWTVESNNRIQASSSKKTDPGLFELHWSDEGSVAFKSPTNNKFITSRMNGSLSASSDVSSEKERFVLSLVNREQMAFRCEWGFLGVKASTCALECNHISPTLFSLQNDKNPHYFFTTGNGKHLKVENNGHVFANADEGTAFLMEFRHPHQVALRACHGNYLVAEQNGLLLAKTSDVEEATLWEI